MPPFLFFFFISFHSKTQMAIRFANLLLSTKFAVISTGFVSIAVIFNQSAPLVSDFAVTELPLIYCSFISWLQPPYLYLVVNFIIISIVATSKLQHHRRHQNLDYFSVPSPEILPQPLPVKDVASVDIPAEYMFVTDQTVQDGRVTEEEKEEDAKILEMDGGYYTVVSTPPPVKDVGSVDIPAEYMFVTDQTVQDGRVTEEEEDAKILEMDGGYYTVVSTPPPERGDSGEVLVENEKYISTRPPVSARFGHKKSLKASTEGGKALRVLKPKRQDTLESTWKTITDGKAMPLTRHLKKSDTWDSRARTVASSPVQPIKKSDTFNDHTSTTTNIAAGKDDSLPSSSGRLRKEPSLSQDELNRKVEAFINKFNEEMRLQRKKSLDQYKQMVGVTGY